MIQIDSICAVIPHWLAYSDHIFQVLDRLQQFGKSDDMYTLLNEYEVKPWESWTIQQKVIHAPGIDLDMDCPH